MIITFIWLKDYIETNKNSKEIAKSLTELGLMLDKPIKNEVLDVEHRMDRSDWLSIVWCAKDLAVFEKANFKFPELKSKEIPSSQEVFIDIKSNKVNRFRTRVIKGVKVGESPEFIKERLSLYGLPCINNIVDITNFVMVELGQPLHAQDLNKFTKKEIILRDSERGEEIQTLDGSVLKLPEGTLVLSENNKPICIGGIVGGLRTGVTGETTDIVLDAGNYKQASIRKASRSLGIFNETVLRSEKFLAPELVDLALIRATDLILQYAGGVAYENDNSGAYEKTSKELVLTRGRIHRILGENIPLEECKEILEKIEYELIEMSDNNATFLTPYFRTDIEVEDDLIADVLRLRGCSKIIPEPIFAPIPKEITPKIQLLVEKVRDILVSAGFHEHITDSFVKYDGLESRIHLMNSVNEDLDGLRTSIKDTLKSVISSYQKNHLQEGKIFEVGKVFYQENGEFLESENLGIMIFSNDIDNTSKSLRSSIDLVLENLGIKDYLLVPSKNHISITISKNSHYGESYPNKEIGQNKEDGEIIGIFDGKFAEFYLDKILRHQKFQSFVVTHLENLAKEDLTYSTHVYTENGEIINFMEKAHPLIYKLEYLSEYLQEDQRKVSVRFYTQIPSELKNIRKTIIEETSKKYSVKFDN